MTEATAATSLAQDAIALLLDLAERGEIDPWDVQVVEAIDRHLRPLIPSEEIEAASSAAGKSPYGADLSRSGQGFLYASMLLLLKADALVEAESHADTPEPEPEYWDHGDDPNALPLHLEKTLRRRAVAPPPRKRPVTLQEMINQIQLMEKTLADTPLRPRSPRTLKQSSPQTARQIGQLAHSENLTETADDIDLFLSENWPQLSQGKSWIDFDRLVAAWSPNAATQAHDQANPDHEPSPAHHHVGTFWALLLLASQSRVELQQTDFYGEIKLRPIDPALEVSAS
jgi:segregation and condensation protein A